MRRYNVFLEDEQIESLRQAAKKAGAGTKVAQVIRTAINYYIANTN